MLTDDDLQVLRSKPWGSALLTLVTNRDFRRLSSEREACQYLTEHCGLCGLYVGRVQSMHLHMRTQHPQFWQHVPNKCIQLCNMYSQEPPCNCCGSNLFRHHHMCPVWAQVALLLIHGGGLEGRSAPNSSAQTLTCDLCNEVFDSPDALTNHLKQAHGLIATTWNQSRDSVANSPACAHCGTLYACMAGLRSHISQGRCAMFNPEASSETQPVAAEWIRYCVNGRLMELYQAPMIKLRLTLTCQCCNRHFKRSMDLSLHLMTAHAALWHASQKTLHILTQTFYEKWGCVCNPTTNVLRAQHVCVPFKQLAMQFHRQTDVLLLPIQLTDQHIATLLSVNLTRQQRFVLEQALTDRRFEAFWTEEAVLEITRNYCLLCGERLHPAEICHHVHEDHVCAHELITYYKKQLTPMFAKRQQADHQCALCHMIFNLPNAAPEPAPSEDRFQLVQIHFTAQCPCLQQACVLLAAALHGCVEPRFPDGSGSQPDARSISTSFANDRQRISTRSRSTTSQTTTGSKKARTSSGKQSFTGPPAHAGDDEAHGHHDPAPRPGPTESEAKRQFHTLLQQGAVRHTGPDAVSGSQMEKSDGRTDHTTKAAIEIISDDQPAERLADPGDSCLQEQTRGPAVQGDCPEQAHAGGLHVAISPMVPPRSDLQAGQQESHRDATNDGHVFGTDRILSEPSVDNEIPCTTGQAGQPNSPLEVAVEREDGCSIRPAEPSLLLRSMGTVGHTAQTSPAIAESTCDGTTGTDGQREGQGENGSNPEAASVTSEDGTLMLWDPIDLAHGLMHLELANATNVCYANAGFFTVMWTLLCVQPFEPVNWGPHFNDLTTFIMLSTGSSKLEPERWFQVIMQSWGNHMSVQPGHQQDSCEFLCHFLAWLGSEMFHMGWERRYVENEQCFLDDQSSAHLPIRLSFEPPMLFLHSCSLDDLIRPWHQDKGMRACLLTAPQCLLLQIDRLHKNDDGEILKCLCQLNLTQTCSMPVFRDDHLRVGYVDYVVTAAIAHFGQDQAGHYRSALRIQSAAYTSDLHAAQWLVTDDNCKPALSWHLPEWFGQHTMVIALTRSDCLALHLYRPEPVHHSPMPDIEQQMTDPTQAILNLCQNLPGNCSKD